MSTKTLEETSLCGVWENVLREEHLKHHRVLTLRVRNVASYSEAASSRVCCSSTTPLTSGSRERCFARTDSLAASPIPRCRLQVPSRRMALVCYHGNGSPGTGRCNHIDDRVRRVWSKRGVWSGSRCIMGPRKRGVHTFVTIPSQAAGTNYCIPSTPRRPTLTRAHNGQPFRRFRARPSCESIGRVPVTACPEREASGGPPHFT